METIKTLYAIPNYECNLNCWYCKLKDKKIQYNEERFLKAINEFNGEIILFGGEPTLYPDRFESVINTGKITSITSNMMNLNGQNAYNSKHCRIATTFRPSKQWFKNLKEVSSINDFGIRILVTLTNDLIRQVPSKLIESLLFLKQNECNIDSILFEQLLDENKTDSFYKAVDEWLYSIHFIYNLEDLGIRSIIVDQILNGWYFNCKNVYTLDPDGTIKQGCPQKERYKTLDKCYMCEKANRCRPCVLQTKCVYPHKFGNEILKRYDKKRRLQTL